MLPLRGGTLPGAQTGAGRQPVDSATIARMFNSDYPGGAQGLKRLKLLGFLLV